jgi:hypothetical protein
VRVIWFCISCVALLVATPAPAFAWGFEGHEVIAAIARSYLTPDVKAKADAILATDTADTLTAPDMVSRSTWADAYRNQNRNTAAWHFVDIELDHPDLDAACFNHPSLNGAPASQGPASDCVVDKIDEFAAELKDPATTSGERALALKFLLHFVGDVHQPLHAADNHDRGGNCVQVSLGGVRTVNLHSFWDTVVINDLGSDPNAVAAALEAKITPSDERAWRMGRPSQWAMESYQVARKVAYALPTTPGCGTGAAPIALPETYEKAADRAAAVQLEKAGVRLAWVLNLALQ